MRHFLIWVVVETTAHKPGRNTNNGSQSERVKRGAALFVLPAAPGRKKRRWKRKTSLRAVGGKASFSGCMAPAGPRQKGYPEAGYCRGRPTRERSGVCGGSINPPRKKAESLLNLRFPRCWIDKSGRVC